MADILLLHTALGLRPGIEQLADRLTSAGHRLHVPDYYGGHVFSDETAGLAHRDRVGARELFTQVAGVVADLPPETVLMGQSLGAAFAQRLAESRPRARAVILMHFAAAPHGSWPGQPVQVHHHAQDPYIEEGAVAALGAAVRASGATFEDFVTPGAGHLFTDPDLPGHDPAATDLVIERICTLLDA